MSPLRRPSVFEPLEPREFLSATLKLPSTDLRFAHGNRKIAYTQYQIRVTTSSATTKSKSKSKTKATPLAGSSTVVGKSPAQVRHAYGVDNILFDAIIGDGTGQTIAIVDAYDNPSFVASTSSNFNISDLHRFDQQFGIPDPPSFKKVSQTGSSTKLPRYDSGWAGEIALDVEWAHAMAPGASILLVEAKSASLTDLNTAVNYAKKQPGVCVVTMSYGTDEYASESSNDSTFTTPSGHTGVTFFSSTGDDGSPGLYQAYSPNVVAVGGTSLYIANSAGTYSSESGWSGSGGGISLYESKPSYQSSVTQSSTKRTTPDVSMVADPYTGVAVLDTSAGGIGSAAGWFQYGGTSLSSPLWAGLVAVANQGRDLLGLSPLDGVSQTLPRLYALNSSDFHDVTSGSNGSFSASAGYDLVTGRGTPIANQLIPDLAGGASLAGTLFSDADADGYFDPGESPLANVTLYLDLNNNGAKDSSEPSSVTTSAGLYSFSDLLGRVSYTLREIIPSGYVATSPSSLPVSSHYGTTTTTNFGLTTPPQTAYAGQTLTVRLDSTATQIQIFTTPDTSGSPAYSIPKSLITTLTLTGTSVNDSLTLDLTNGNPLFHVAASYDAGTGSADTLLLRGSPSANSATFSNTSITADGSTLSVANLESYAFDGSGGDDTVSISGTLPLTFPATQQLQSLSLAASSRATLAPGHNVLYTRSLSLTPSSTLDVTDGTLIDDNPNPNAPDTTTAYLVPLLHSAYNNGTWTGPGLTSSTAANDPAHGTALGYLTAADLGVTSYAGFAVSPTALILRYTYAGDATLNVRVNADDLALADVGRARNTPSWLFGDFDYDGQLTPADTAILLNSLQAALPPLT